MREEYVALFNGELNRNGVSTNGSARYGQGHLQRTFIPQPLLATPAGRADDERRQRLQSHAAAHDSAPRAEIRSAASSAALEELRPDFVPWNAIIGMCIRFRNATLQLRDLGRTQRKGLSPHIGLLCDTVPDILNELHALVDGEMTVVESWLCQG